MKNSPARSLIAVVWLLSAGVWTPAAGSDDHVDVRFRDVTRNWALDFVHERGALGDKHLPETMGAGVAWGDWDRDGRSDLYLVQSGTLPGESANPYRNQHMRNLGDRLEPVASGADNAGYGMGATSADYDGDGWPDLYVSNFGADVLLRNNGDGTFTDVTASAGFSDTRWSASATWADLDGDFFPDLYVTRYVSYDLATAPSCGQQQHGMKLYCHINVYDGEPDSVYRNRGDGTFEDITEAAGIAALPGKGLGVVAGDIDLDGDTDIFVANDTERNFLHRNDGSATLEESGLFLGVAYGDLGEPQAGMGTVMADLDGVLPYEVLVTNFALEVNNFYRQVAPGVFADQGHEVGFAAPGLSLLAFGIETFDADGDGDREIVLVNGHVLDNVESLQDNATHAQPNLVFRNDLVDQRRLRKVGGGADEDVFVDVTASAFAEDEPDGVSRGLAVGDIDADGRPDFVVTNNGGAARLLHNDGSPENRRLVVRLSGRRSGRDALGARIAVIPAGADTYDGARGYPQYAESRAASSYLSQSSMDHFFGLGANPYATVWVHWPNGVHAVFADVPADHLILIVEGAATLVQKPLPPR